MHYFFEKAESSHLFFWFFRCHVCQQMQTPPVCLFFSIFSCFPPLLQPQPLQIFPPSPLPYDCPLFWPFMFFFFCHFWINRPSHHHGQIFVPKKPLLQRGRAKICERREQEKYQSHKKDTCVLNCLLCPCRASICHHRHHPHREPNKNKLKK